MLTTDEFLGGKLLVQQPQAGYRAAIDPVLLAASIDANPKQSILELGCGTGVVLLCLSWRVSDLILHGVEIQPLYVKLARQNAIANGFNIYLWEHDLAALPTELRQLNFDCVVMNPPYRPCDQGPTPLIESKRIASVESVPLSVWIEVAVRRIKPGGFLHIIIPPSRLQDIITALPASMGGIVIKPVRARMGSDARRLLVRATKGSRTNLRVLSDLILHDDKGQKYADGAAAILRDGAAITL